MLAIPILDLGAGTACRPSRTDSGPGTVAQSPVAAARAWATSGFRRLHVMDLDAVNGSGSNTATVEGVIRDGAVDVQAEGGLQSTGEIDRLIDAGAVRVVVGARALGEPDWLAKVAGLFPGAVVVATDLRQRRVATRGWIRSLPFDVLDVVAELAGLPLGGLLVTSSSDGSRSAIDLALLEEIAEASAFPLIAAGGIASMDDLRALEHRGVSAVLLGAVLQSSALDARAVAQEFGE